MCFVNYTLKEKEVTWYFNMFQYSISIVNAIEIKNKLSLYQAT